MTNGEWVIVGLLLLLAYFLFSKIDGLKKRVLLDFEFDNQIDEQTKQALSGEQKHLETLERQKQLLPRLGTWAIATNSRWESDVIAGAEKLRGLILQRHGDHPDGHLTAKSVDEVKMNYDLAFSLVEVAQMEAQRSVKTVEWRIKKIEMLGEMRKRQPNLSAVAYGEQELNDLDQERRQMSEELTNLHKALWDEFVRARDATR